MNPNHNPTDYSDAEYARQDAEADDYHLWKLWWMATTYNAAPETRMAAVDRVRTLQAESPV